MPTTLPYRGRLRNEHVVVELATGDALMVKAQDATSSAFVALDNANGQSFSAQATSGQTALQVGPFAAAVTIAIAATGSVRVETSVAGISVAV